jgi:hypothetical protein
MTAKPKRMTKKVEQAIADVLDHEFRCIAIEQNRDGHFTAEEAVAWAKVHPGSHLHRMFFVMSPPDMTDAERAQAFKDGMDSAKGLNVVPLARREG